MKFVGRICGMGIVVAVCFGRTGLASPQGSAVVERGPFHRVWQNMVLSTNRVNGSIVTSTNTYTEVGDGLCYQENGQWLDSQDLIEITPDGAAALHGPTKAHFNANLNTAGAVTMITASGEIFKSHPSALYYEDTATGKIVLIASVKDSKGVLAPPNEVAYNDAFDGLRIDVTYVYAKNGLEQNVVFLQAPAPPDTGYGMNPATTRIHLVTAFDQVPVPKRQTPITLKAATNPKSSDLVDNLLLFNDLWFPVGAAFGYEHSKPVLAGQPKLVRVPESSDPDNVLIAKTLTQVNNQNVLIETVDYNDLLPKFKNLRQAALPAKPDAKRQVAAVPLPPSDSGNRVGAHSFALASAPYQPHGLVWDYTTLSGTLSDYTFTNGSTYVISNTVTFNSSATATFQANTCVKYATNAYMLVSGPVSFPTSGIPPVFTSADDNVYGESIPNSTGNPGYAALHHLSFYYDSNSSTVQHARFRWAQDALQYDGTGSFISYSVSYCEFENCTYAVRENIPNSSLTLTKDTGCSIGTGLSVTSGAHSGTVSVVSPINVSRFTAIQGEPSIAINPTNPDDVVVVANNTGGASLFIGISTDAGASFSTNFLSNLCCDPSLTWDSYGNLFLACVGTPTTNVVVLLSTNNGTTFTTNFVFSTSSGVDYPRITSGPNPTYGNHTYLTFYSYDAISLLAAGANVTGLGAAHIGAYSVTNLTRSTDGNFGGVTIVPNGTTVATFQLEDHAVGPSDIYVAANPNGVGQAFGDSGYLLTSQVGYSQSIPAQPTRNIDVGLGLASDLSGGTHSGRAYMVYTDRPSGSTNVQTDIYVIYSDNAGTSWSTGSPVKVNDDSKGMSHFWPHIAVDSTTGNVAVAWYDCREDTPGNTKTRFYAAISRDGGATFCPNIQLEPGQSNASGVSDKDYFDFTGLAYYGGVMYAAWADNSNSTGNNPDGTSSMDVYVTKLAY